MKALYLFALLFATDAAACNNLRFDQLDDVDFTNNGSPSETMRVRKNGNGSCDFFITVDNGDAASFSGRRMERIGGSETIPVQICGDAACSTILKHFPEATSNGDVITGVFAANPDQQFVTFYPRLGTLDYQRFGNYRDTYTVRLYEGTINGGYNLRDSDTFRLEYTMSKKIDLSLVNTGQPFDLSSTNKALNFGVLSTGQQQTVDLVLKFNAGYEIKLSSQNNGALKHASLPNTIAYTLTSSGNPVNLAGSSGSPVTVAQGTGTSPAGGLRFPGVFTIGTVGPGAQAGTYSDLITVTVSTTE